MYTRLAITGSPTKVETKKGFERISWLILKFSSILSSKKQSSLYCLYTEWTICESKSLSWLNINFTLSLPVTCITPHILITSLINICGSHTFWDPETEVNHFKQMLNTSCHWSTFINSWNSNLLIVLVGHTLSQKLN